VSTLLDRPRLVVPIGPRDHAIGPATARLTLLEYGDYECPYCGAAHPVAKQVLRLLEGELLFAYRHFPLTQIHPHAMQAAEAAEAAGAQGHFWEMHDLLFDDQDRLDAEDLLTRARLLGLDLELFASDLAQHRHAARVREDFLSGVRTGVNGTPTFFANGVRHNGPAAVDALLASLGVAGR
jgi:protein-disulfide isomerase